MQKQIVESYCDMPHRAPKGHEGPVEIPAIASHVVTVLTQGERPRTVRLDLCETDDAKFLKVFAPYFEHGTIVKAVSVSGSGAKRAVRHAPAQSGNTRSFSPEDNRAIREWAAEQGYGVSPRGRISQTVIEAYVEAGHPAPTPIAA